MSHSRKLTAILFTDIVGYTKLMGLDEAQAWQILKRNRSIHKKLIRKYSGKYLKEMGDGILASFSSTLDAVYCAGELQQILRSDPELKLRIGINLGDVLVEGDDIFGDEVNVASRLQTMAEPGQILVTELISNGIQNKEGIETGYLGEFELKNVSRPVKVYKILVCEFPKRKVRNLTNSKLLNYFISIFISLVVLYLLVDKLVLPKFDSVSFTEQKLEVYRFKNETEREELDMLGEQIRIKIQHSLTECCPDSKLNSDLTSRYYYRDKDVAKIQFLASDDLREVTGAENSISGKYYLLDDNTVVIEAVLERNSHPNEPLQLAKEKTNIGNPEVGMNKLADRIAGYWLSKDDPIYRGNYPTQQAYNEINTAIEKWLMDSLALIHINNAIESDPAYYKAYFFRAALEREAGEFSKRDSTISFLEEERADMAPNQKLFLDYLQAERNGDLNTTYELFKFQYNHDTKNFFYNASMANLALLAANKPLETIDILSEVTLTNIDCYLQSYCIEYRSTLVISYIESKQYNKALKALEEYSSIHKNNRYYRLLVRTLIKSVESDDELIGMLNDLITNKINIDEDLLYFYIIYESYGSFRNQIVEEFSDQFFNQDGKSYETNTSLAAAIHIYNEQFGEAIKIYNSFESLSSFRLLRKSIALIKQGDLVAANEIIPIFDKRSEKFNYGDSEYNLAMIETAKGNYDQAIKYLNQSIGKGMKFYYTRFQNDADLRDLFDNPGFIRLVTPKG